MITKIVENNHYHVWTDALHARELARQTGNKWDRGTYVRWTLISAWIALEIACQDATSDPSISYSFKKNLDEAIEKNQLPKIDWSQGIWQRVLKVQELRKNAVHRILTEKDLFPDVDIAEMTIDVLRDAIISIYTICGKSVPSWVDDNYDEGWTTGKICAHGIIINSPYNGVPNAIKLAYVYKGHEYVYDYLAPDTDVNQPIENIFKGVGKPITAVRLYRGDELLVEYLFESTKIRGA